MTLEGIRSDLMEQLTMDIDLWADELDNTTPGHYGIDNWQVIIESDSYFNVDIPKRTFSFNKVIFRATLRLGGSNDESGFDHSFNEFASGTGTFEFIEDNNKVQISELTIDMNLDIFKQ